MNSTAAPDTKRIAPAYSAEIFWVDETCSCSSCCSRHLWFYDRRRLGRVTFALECVPPIPIPNGILDESSPGAYWWLSSLSSLPSSLASHADVLRGSSRVPGPLSEAGTRDEPLRTSPWEATSSSALLVHWLLLWMHLPSQWRNVHILTYARAHMCS